MRCYHLLARQSDPLEGVLQLTWYVRPTRDQCEVLVSALRAICSSRKVQIVSDYLIVELVVGDGRIYENVTMPRMIAGRPIKYVREEGGAFEGLRVSDSNQAEEEQTKTCDVREMIDGSWTSLLNRLGEMVFMQTQGISLLLSKHIAEGEMGNNAGI